MDDLMPQETTRLRWFDAFPVCSCGKTAQGILRGDGNQSYGNHCRKCAEKRLRDSEKARNEQGKIEQRMKELADQASPGDPGHNVR